MEKNNLIVFDMDGVLIDVSKSYRDTTRQAARLFFSPARAADSLPDPLFSAADLAAVKQSGGLNNDWDLTRAVIRALFTGIGTDTLSQHPDPWVRWRETLSACDITSLITCLENQPRALLSLYENTGSTPSPFVDDLYTGDVGSGNLIKQIFQEIYLGDDIFTATYSLMPQVYREKGFIHRESLIIDRDILQELAKNSILAIATGRPAAEARYPLELNGLGDLFATVLSLDDCLSAEAKALEKSGRITSLSKPHPYMLDEIAALYANRVSSFYYIGDMPDDMEAARRSAWPYRGIGVMFTSPDPVPLKAALTAAGAVRVVREVGQLVQVLQS